MALLSHSLCTNSSLVGAVMPLWIDFHQTECMRWLVSKPPLVKINSIILFTLMYYIYIEKGFVRATTYQFYVYFPSLFCRQKCKCKTGFRFVSSISLSCSYVSWLYVCYKILSGVVFCDCL